MKAQRNGLFLLFFVVLCSSTTAAIVASASSHDDPRAAAASSVDYCPSKERVAAFAARTGLDYKPTVPCSDPNDAADANASAPAPPGPPPIAADIEALRAKFVNDPNVVVGIDPDGPSGAITMNIVQGEPLPEGIDTPEELDRYLGTGEK